MMGCSTPNPAVRFRELPGGGLEVDGPLAGPFESLEALAEHTCELMTGQPGASSGPYGMEYCALHYFSQKEQAYYLSYLSDLGGTRPNGDKYCFIPSSLNDPSHPDALILGGDHSHPHNRRFSPRDLSAATIRYPTRIVDQGTGKVLHRQLLMLYREKNGECRAYAFDHVNRVVSALRSGAWVPIGDVPNDQGHIELRPGQDQVP
ncbi:hypothetical protein [Corallococcus sp. AB011P]|uniref:hypothetical protein n=1 Tax=Corallococcus sp. AB011P TaxID=2316735 RepID=UPI001F473AF1|nr:hypothetical protein [Corallococcus sp. AB011P]